MKVYPTPEFSASRLVKDAFWSVVFLGICGGSLALFGGVKFWKWSEGWIKEFLPGRELP